MNLRGVALAAAAVLILGVGAVMLREESPNPVEAPVFRGGPAAQVIVSADPATLARSMNDDLDRLALEPMITHLGATAAVEARWPLDAGPPHLDLLKRYGLERPKTDRLRVEIRSGK